MDESEIQSINRRDVLLLAAAAGATLSVPSLVLAGGSKASPPAHSGDPSMGHPAIETQRADAIPHSMKVKGHSAEIAIASRTAFAVNDSVRIKNKTPVGHYRTPFYVRNKTGRIERILDEFINPEEEAYGKNSGSKVRLYRVSFAQQELWPEYRGASNDKLQIEISEHWLESA